MSLRAAISPLRDGMMVAYSRSEISVAITGRLKSPTTLVTATAVPFRKPADVSFQIARGQYRGRFSHRAGPRIVTASAWTPLWINGRFGV